MAKGENIFKRKDGRWEARYPKGRTDSGRIQYGFCYGKTYKEAKEKAAEARGVLVKAPPAESRAPVLCFAAYCDIWLESKRAWLKTATYIKYESILTHHIKPELGSRSAEVITTASITAFSRRLLEEKHLSPKTVRDILTVLKLILRDTSAQLSLPPVVVPSPKLPKSSIRVLTRAEQARLVSYLLSDRDACKFGIFLALLTGLRIGELCALRWEDICLGEVVPLG